MNKKQLWIRVGVMLAVVVAMLVLDLVTKYVFDAKLSDGQEITIIPYLFNFRLVHNTGAAWGMLAGNQAILIVLSVVFLIMFAIYYVKEKNKNWFFNITFAFLFAGCLGNLFDRIFLHYVRDFIEFAFWQTFPIFNFADVFLTVGIFMFLIYLLIYCIKNSQKSQKNGEKTKKEGKND